MRITNKLNLPNALINYVRSKKYSKGDADWSVTTLIDSPRIHFMNKDYYNKMEKDISDDIFSALGSAIHNILEEGSHFDCITEKRLFMNRRGRRISGQIDIQELLPDGSVRVIDFKVTSVWAKIIEKGIKPDWVKQLNCYAELVEESGRRVDSLAICVFYRDWAKREVGRKEGYPKTPIEVIEIPLWPAHERAEYIDSRVAKFIQGEAMVQSGNGYPLCSSDERWAKGGRFALKIKGSTKALRLMDDRDELLKYAVARGLATRSGNNINLASNAEIEERETEYVRCKDWCGVSKWCNQYKASLVNKASDKYEKSKSGSR